MPQPPMDPARLALYERFVDYNLRNIVIPPELGLMSRAEFAERFRPVMLSGCWLETELKQLGCTRATANLVCHDHGRRSAQADPWDVAAAVLAEYRAGMRPWVCLKCGVGLHRDAAVEAQALAQKLIHVCGQCKQFHLVTPEWTLRVPTAAEMFDIYMQCPNITQRVERLGAMEPGHVEVILEPGSKKGG